MPAYFCGHFHDSLQPEPYGLDYFFISNSVIPSDCQSRAGAVALALYMTQSEMKTQLFPKEPIVSDYNPLKYTEYAQRLYNSHGAFESIR